MNIRYRYSVTFDDTVPTSIKYSPYYCSSKGTYNSALGKALLKKDRPFGWMLHDDGSLTYMLRNTYINPSSICDIFYKVTELQKHLTSLMDRAAELACFIDALNEAKER